MAIIRQGRILACCEPQQAIDQLKGSVWEATLRHEEIPAVKSRFKIISSQMFSGLPRVKVISKGERPGEEFTPVTPTLEDYYLNLVSQQTSE
jgi:ABC-2 type transport system ATP-binding protein